MGHFEKDQSGRIMPQNTEKGLVDTQGRIVNERGYLIDLNGNVIDNNDRLIWQRKDLKNGEFPKIFPFTKFNIKRIQGDFDINEQNQIILNKNAAQ